MDKEQMRKERFEEILSYFKDTDVRTIDPILYKIRMSYPWLKDETVREYARSVMRVLEVKQKDGA
jgi:hypothetical protein